MKISCKSGQIISASRRTDIPAFYSDWFMRRLRKGFVVVPNPFNAKQVSRVSLQPQNVLAIVFWTRNPRPLLPYFPELHHYGYRFYFQWSLNHFPSAFEESGPSAKRMIETMHRVAELLSPDHIQWRYDPIILSNITPPEWHVENFRWLATQLRGATRRCYFSFLDFYKKTQRNLKQLEPDVSIDIPEVKTQRELIIKLQNIARANKIEMYACCEDHLLEIPGIHKAHCVDLDIIYRLYPEVAETVPEKATRPECGCFASKDIGAYNSCLFRCTYCYANADFEKRSLPRHARHDPARATLIP